MSRVYHLDRPGPPVTLRMGRVWIEGQEDRTQVIRKISTEFAPNFNIKTKYFCLNLLYSV